MNLHELQTDKRFYDLVVNAVWLKQNQVCAVCGDDIDWDNKIVAVNNDIKTIADLKLVCNGKCALL